MVALVHTYERETTCKFFGEREDARREMLRQFFSEYGEIPTVAIVLNLSAGALVDMLDKEEEIEYDDEFYLGPDRAWSNGTGNHDWNIFMVPSKL